MRSAVSALSASGHPDARTYTVGTVWREIEYVRRRENMALANQAVMMQMVVNTAMGGKESAQELQNYIKRLTNE